MSPLFSVIKGYQPCKHNTIPAGGPQHSGAGCRDLHATIVAEGTLYDLFKLQDLNEGYNRCAASTAAAGVQTLPQGHPDRFPTVQAFYRRVLLTFQAHVKSGLLWSNRARAEAELQDAIVGFVNRHGPLSDSYKLCFRYMERIFIQQLPDGTVKTFSVPSAMTLDGGIGLWRAPKELELELARQKRDRPLIQGHYDVEMLQQKEENSSTFYFASILPRDSRELLWNLHKMQTTGFNTDHSWRMKVVNALSIDTRVIFPLLTLQLHLDSKGLVFSNNNLLLQRSSEPVKISNGSWVLGRKPLALKPGATVLLIDALEMPPRWCEGSQGCRDVFTYQEDHRNARQLCRIQVEGVSVDPAYPRRHHISNLLQAAAKICQAMDWNLNIQPAPGTGLFADGVAGYKHGWKYFYYYQRATAFREWWQQLNQQQQQEMKQQHSQPKH